MTHWALQDAKGKFSEVVSLARREGPQLVTLRGREAVVIIAVEQYRKMTKPQGDDFVNFLRQSPLNQVGDFAAERSRDAGRQVAL